VLGRIRHFSYSRSSGEGLLDTLLLDADDSGMAAKPRLGSATTAPQSRIYSANQSLNLLRNSG